MADGRALVTLTSDASKRLIAKGIVALPIVQKARLSGVVGFCKCSSARYVAEELLGELLPVTVPYYCGYISQHGLFALSEGQAGKELVLEKGEPVWLDWPGENITRYIKTMGAQDVIVKSGNALDPSRKAWTLVGQADGGEYGKYLPYILARGINLIVPMTLNKSVPYLLDEIALEMGITRISPNRAHGEPCGMLPLPGLVVTEVEALNTLAAVRALPVAMGGIGDGKGCVTLLMIGEEQNLETAWNLIESIKSEPPLDVPSSQIVAGSTQSDV